MFDNCIFCLTAVLRQNGKLNLGQRNHPPKGAILSNRHHLASVLLHPPLPQLQSTALTFQRALRSARTGASDPATSLSHRAYGRTCIVAL